MPNPKETKEQETPVDQVKEAEVLMGAKPETLPFNTTKEDLKKLRHEIEAGKIPKNRNEYNHPETKLEKTDTMNSLLEKVFSQKNLKMPKGTVERIELALTAKGITMDAIAKKFKVDTWKVEKGKMYFMAPEKEGKISVIVFDILPWRALKSSLEIQEEQKKNYELGKNEGGIDISNPKTASIEAGVDATRHTEKLRTETWYKTKSEAANLLLKIYKGNPGRLDAPTISFLNANNRIKKLEDLASQTDFTPGKFNANFEKKFVAANGKNELYGREGLYNLVLAFQRVMDAHKGKELNDSKITISLRIGTTIKEVEERYAKVTTAAYDLTDDPGIINTPEEPEPVPPPPPPEPPEPDPKPTPKPAEKERGMFQAVRPRAATLLPTADQFNENLDPEIASGILIESYRDGGLNSLLAGLKQLGPEKAETALKIVFEKLKLENPKEALKLMSELVEGNAPEMKKRFDEAMKEAIDKETNPENKKALQLMKLLNDVKYDVEHPNETVRRKEEGRTNVMRQIVEMISSIDDSKLSPEFKEFFTPVKANIESHLRLNMALDMVETTDRGLDSAFIDRLKTDVTFANSLEELRKMSPEDIGKALRNEGLTEWIDRDAEIYLASRHVMEAMRVYLTYQYPQEVAKGTKIDNPVKWALEQVKSGTSINIPKEAEKGSYYDVYTDGPKPIDPGTTLDINTLFIDKNEELRLFDEYQKGEERIGATSIWNAFTSWERAGTTVGGVVGMGAGPIVSAIGTTQGKGLGMALDKILPSTGAGEKLAESRAAFLGTEGGLLDTSEKLFSAELKNFMNENGDLGQIEKMELLKILYLVQTKNYDEARSNCARILIDKLTEPTDAEINAKAKEIDDEKGSQIRAQAKLVLEKDPRMAGKPWDEIKKQIDISAEEVIKDQAYLYLLGEQTKNINTAGLSEFEKRVMDVWHDINGFGTLDWQSENADFAISIGKILAEIVAIEVVTIGLGTYAAGAAGAGRLATLGGRAVSSGLNVAKTTRVAEGAFNMGMATRTSMTGTRLASILGRARVGAGTRYLAEGATWHARTARNVVHAAALSQGLHMMHGRSLQVIDDPYEAAYEIASTAVTLQVLGSTQRFMRGQYAGTPVIGRASGGVNKALGRLPVSPGRIPDLRNIPEMAGELGVIHYLGKAEKWARVKTGTVTQTQMEAMEGPEWREWVHSAAVVTGLRLWGNVGQRSEPTPQPTPIQLTGRPAPKQLPVGPQPPKQMTGRPAPKQLPVGPVAPKQMTGRPAPRQLPQKATPPEEMVPPGKPKKPIITPPPSGPGKEPIITPPPEAAPAPNKNLIVRLNSGNIPKEYPKTNSDAELAAKYWKTFNTDPLVVIKKAGMRRKILAAKDGGKIELPNATKEEIQNGMLSGYREVAANNNLNIGNYTITPKPDGMYTVTANITPEVR